MLGCAQIARWDDPSGWEALSESLRAWEPRLDLHVPPRDARLYEPDGTLYAVCLGASMTLRLRHREIVAGLGDAIVLPQGVALDVEPEVRVLGLRYDGPPPDHFRERFIQVWGFEHAPAPALGSAPGAHEVIAASDLRHRVPYAIWTGEAGGEATFATGPDRVLLVGLDGNPRLAIAGERSEIDLEPGVLAIVDLGTDYRLRGEGRVGRLTLANELVHETRRREALLRGAFSPEYSPAPSRPAP